VAAVAFHADGKRLVTAGADKTARLWTPALLWRATVGGPARQAVWTPNGQTVVAVGDDKSVRLLEAATGKESKVLTGHAGPVRSVSVSADAAKAATGSDDGTAVVWTLADGKAVTTIKAGAPVTRVSLSPDGKRVGVAFTTAGKAVTAVHDAATGDELQTFAEAGGRALAFAADNRTLLALPENDKTVHLLDVAVVSARKAHEGSVTALAVVPGADQPITAGKDKTARRWSPNEAKEVRAFGPLADPATAVAVSRDGAQLALAGGKVVKLYDASSGAEAATLTHPAEVVSVAFSPDRSRILTGATDNLARVWDVKSGVVLQLFSHGGAVRGVAWHPSDANRVVTASADKTAAAHTVTLQRLVALPKPAAGLTVAPNGSHLLVWDETDDVKLVNVGGGNFERTFAGNKGPVKAAAFSKDQQRVAVAGADKQVRIFGANDAREFAGFALPAPAVALQYNPTATAIAAALADGTVGAWNATVQPGQQPPPELGRAVQTFSHPGAAVALFNSDGTGLFTGGSDKAVRQWKLAADTPLKRFDHPNLVDAVAFSPDGKTLLTGCHDGLARTFDIAKGAVLKAVNAHDKPMPAPIYAVAWTPDGKQFATASYDHSVKLWDAAGGTMVREFKGWTEKTFEQGHREGIFSLAFSPDGKYLATASSDRDVKLWDVAQGTVVRTFANPNLKADAPPVVGKPAPPPPSHPSWVYAVRFTPDGKYLVSAGTSPRDRKANPDRNRGYLAVWNPADGKLVSAQEYPLGGLYSLAVASDNERAVLGCGPASRDAGKVDAVVVKLPK
jgi:WD40 repeat protein